MSSIKEVLLALPLPTLADFEHPRRHLRLLPVVPDIRVGNPYPGSVGRKGLRQELEDAGRVPPSSVVVSV